VEVDEENRVLEKKTPKKKKKKQGYNICTSICCFTQFNSAPQLFAITFQISPTFYSDFNNLVTYKLGICTTQSPYQTVGTHYWCSSLLGLPMCKSSILCAGVQTDGIQSGIVVALRNLLAVVVVEGGERRLHLGLLGMPLDCEERESE
jgi:hypothetical protein